MKFRMASRKVIPMNKHDHITEVHVPPKSSSLVPMPLCCCFSRMQLRPGYDFSTDLPPMSQCAICTEGFEEWDAENEEWQLLPEKYWKLHICHKDYERLLREAGHDGTIPGACYCLWNTRVRLWYATKNQPKDRVHLYLPDVNQIVWCKPVAERGEGHLVVRLQSAQVGRAPASGSLFRARWDGRTISGFTGRPVLEPIRRLYDLGNEKSKRPLHLPWLDRAVPTGVN